MATPSRGPISGQAVGYYPLDEPLLPLVGSPLHSGLVGDAEDVAVAVSAAGAYSGRGAAPASPRQVPFTAKEWRTVAGLVRYTAAQ